MLRYDISPDKLEEQIAREKLQREAALGRRFAAADAGLLGPVISRWINASVSPVAQRVRHAAERYIAGDLHTFGKVLDTPTFGLAAAYESGSPEYLEPILKWCLKGSSPGRIGGEATYCEDLVLAVIGKTVSDLAMRSLTSKNHLQDTVPGLSLAMVLSGAAQVTRETALGQFITMVQGAEAMAKVRRWDRSSWAQTNKMKRIANLLAGQVRHTLAAQAKGEIDLARCGSRTIIKVLDPTRASPEATRHLSLKADDLVEDDWKLLNMTVFPKGEADPAKNAWITFAMMVLCAAQVEHGWFDITKEHSPRALKTKRAKGRTRYLLLAEKPRHHLKGDLSKWIEMGFAFDPMVIPPPDGTYLTVKTKAVTGRNGPYGWRTHGEGTTAWEIAGDVLAATPWQVARETLAEIRAEGGRLQDAAAKVVPDELTRALILGAYSKDSYQDAIFLPLYMDFRGRIYPRTSWVSYQGGDLQKGLLKFTPSLYNAEADETALALHVTGLMGLDKKALPERLAVYRSLNFSRREVPMAVEEPTQLWTALDLIARGKQDQVPVQIDGTCNGLQHLSAMFRDHEAAPWVNLAASSHETPPNDLYGEVAGIATKVVTQRAAAGEAWAMRLEHSGGAVNRAVCKRPVMVLPYGGSMIAIEEGVMEGLLGQASLKATLWLQCQRAPGIPDLEALAGNYMAFSNRPLKEHPLFKKDMQRLAKVVYDAIRVVIPRAMAAMDAFKAIAGNVEGRALEWSNGVGPNPMWIVHAYPKSDRRTNIFRGFHLPNSVRGLAMKCGRDEVNPAMHRTGIVANFIHSQDAAHLVATMGAFRRASGTAIGANHDCLYGRPSEAKILHRAVREAFRDRYFGDPLASPVRLRAPGPVEGEDLVEPFESWYALADHFGVRFPDMGRWDPSEVVKSAWFFS